MALAVLLWNKKYDEAKVFYQELVKDNPTNFVAHLGFANTLSNLKEYQQALVYVNKALVVAPGNPNALTSRKYMYLGYAYQNQQAQDYVQAERILKELSAPFYIYNREIYINASIGIAIKSQHHKSAEDLLSPLVDEI